MCSYSLIDCLHNHSSVCDHNTQQWHKPQWYTTLARQSSFGYSYVVMSCLLRLTSFKKARAWNVCPMNLLTGQLFLHCWINLIRFQMSPPLWACTQWREVTCIRSESTFMSAVACSWWHAIHANLTWLICMTHQFV